MYSLTLPNSPTALRLGAEYLTKLAEQSEAIRNECGAERIVAQRVGDVARVLCETVRSTPEELASLLPQQPEPARVLEVATPAPGSPAGAEPAPADPIVEDSGSTGAVVVAPAAPAAPLPEPELVYNEAAAGFPEQAMRDAGWSDDQLVAAGYAEWVEVPKPAAPSASAGSVPTPPPVAPAPPALATSLDSAGLPWDERIHSSSKNTVADGTWRRKRGVDEALVASVEAELRALMGNAPAAGAGAPTAESAPIAPVPPQVTPAAPAPAASGPTTFKELTDWLLGLTKAGKLSPTDVTLAIQSLGAEGVSMLPHLANRLDLIPEVAAKLAEKVTG